MSHDISASEVALFDAEVKQVYQEKGGKIRPVIYTKTGVVGGSVHMPVYSRGFAQDAATGGNDVQTMGTSTSDVEITLTGKEAAEYSNIFEQDTVSFDDRSELAKVVATALGRTEDQFAIDALGAGTFAGDNSVAVDFEVSGTKSGLTIEKLIEASVVLDDAGVEEEDRYVVAPAKAARTLLKDAKATSSDYVDSSSMVNGRISKLLGFTFIWIGDSTNPANSDFYGLPKDDDDATLRTCYAFHRDALGMAVGNLDKAPRIDYVPHKSSYLVNAPLRAGAAIRDITGIVEINIQL